MTTPQPPAEPPLRLGRVRPKSAESTSAESASAESTIRLDPKASRVPEVPGAPEPTGSTIQLGPQSMAQAQPQLQPQAHATVQLNIRNAAPAESTVFLERPAQTPADDVAEATFLDPSVWGSAGSAPEDGLRRVGPGVPPQAAAVWHGTVEQAPAEPERRRRRRGWLLPVVVLLAVLAYLAWQRYAPPTTVTGVAVSTDSAGPSCDGTAVVTATLETKGRAGVVRYHWIRSDGTDSGSLSQPVPSGRHRTDVVLRWTFQGHGTMNATATVDVLSPSVRSAAVSFTYACP